MNRILSTFIIGLTVFLPSAVFASTVSLSPTAVSVTQGKVFTVRVVANPSSEKIYTVRANISFNPALVKVTGFTFAPKWLALSATGYDLTDNTKGSLIKTAGYPGGFTAPILFGTITFTAKASGTAYISVTTKSMVLDSNSKNTISGTQGVSTVTVATPKKTVVKKYVKKYVKKATTVKKAVKVVAPVVATTTATTSEEVATTSESTSTPVLLGQAAAANTSNGGDNNLIWWVLGAVAVVLGVVWASFARRGK